MPLEIPANFYRAKHVDMLAGQVDERYPSNGNPYLFVSGYLLPGAQDVALNPAQPKLNPVLFDARMPPIQELRSHPGEYDQVSAKLPSLQPDVAVRIEGMGIVLKDQAATNVQRTVGDPTIVAADVDDAMWFIVKRTGTAGNYGFTIPRTIVTGLDTTAMPMLSLYNPATDGCLGVTGASPGLGATETVADYFNGHITVTGLAVEPSGASFKYDPSAGYSVHLSLERKAVDFINADVVSGDTCYIVGAAFKWGQLANAGDYSLYRPNSELIEVSLDMLLCLGDAPNGNMWKWWRFPRAQQVMRPERQFSSASGEANSPEARWRVKPVGIDILGASYVYDEDTIILP